MGTGTHPAEQYIDEYSVVYHDVYGQSPKVHYIGNQWYQVNGEITTPQPSRTRDGTW